MTVPPVDALGALDLEPEAAAARAGRNFVSGILTNIGRTDLCDSALLGVSELVTNACLHARTVMSLVVTRAGRGVRIAVTDRSPVIPRPREFHRSTATTGRGLRLLDALGSWGVVAATDGPGKTVWFEPSAQEPSADEVMAAFDDAEWS